MKKIPGPSILLLLLAVVALLQLVNAQFLVTVTPKTPSNLWYAVGSTDAFAIDGEEGKSLSLIRGLTYTFTGVNLPPSHHFYISESENGAGGEPFLNGVIGNFMTGNDTLYWSIPTSGPRYLFYQSFDGVRVGGRITLRGNDPPEPTALPCITSLEAQGPATPVSYCTTNCATRSSCFSCCDMFTDLQGSCRTNCNEFFNASAVDDPHFIGFLGQKFDFMGYPNQVFNLISDRHVQLNARFSGVPGLAPMSSSGLHGPSQTYTQTFMTEMGIKIGRSDRIRIKCAHGKDLETEINGLSLDDENSYDGHFQNARMRVFSVREHSTIHIAMYRYTLTLWALSAPGMSCYLNIEASFHQVSRTDPYPHGVLGQTADPHTAGRDPVTGMRYMFGSTPQGKPIVTGEPADYQLRSENVFGDDFTFNRYEGMELLMGPAGFR